MTGATGFIGSAVARALLDSGTEVRALVRQGTDLRALEGLTVEIVRGDLCNAGSLRIALKGCQQLYLSLIHI